MTRRKRSYSRRTDQPWLDGTCHSQYQGTNVPQSHATNIHLSRLSTSRCALPTGSGRGKGVGQEEVRLDRCAQSAVSRERTVDGRGWKMTICSPLIIAIDVDRALNDNPVNEHVSNQVGTRDPYIRNTRPRRSNFVTRISDAFERRCLSE